MKRLIIFLIRKRLGLKKYESFRFSNQKSNDIYYFNHICLMKEKVSGKIFASTASLNWILADDCEVVKIKTSEETKNERIKRKR